MAQAEREWPGELQGGGNPIAGEVELDDAAVRQAATLNRLPVDSVMEVPVDLTP